MCIRDTEGSATVEREGLPAEQRPTVILEDGETLERPTTLKLAQRGARPIRTAVSTTSSSSVPGRLIGVYHYISRGHLNRYCDEFVFRYENRKMSDGPLAQLLVAGAASNRLTYKQPDGISARSAYEMETPTGSETVTIKGVGFVNASIPH
jgi:hypothetical protein